MPPNSFCSRVHSQILQTALPDFNIISHGTLKSRLAYGDNARLHRINLELLQEELPLPSSVVQVLICGTKSFDKDMINFLRKLGYREEAYFKF